MNQNDKSKARTSHNYYCLYKCSVQVNWCLVEDYQSSLGDYLINGAPNSGVQIVSQRRKWNPGWKKNSMRLR